MKLKSIGKRGNIFEAVSNMQALIVGLFIVVGLIVGVMAFRASQVTNVANCGLNRTGGAAVPLYTACNAAYNLTTNVGLMSNNFGGQLPTIGTILAVTVLLSAIGFLAYNHMS